MYSWLDGNLASGIEIPAAAEACEEGALTLSPGLLGRDGRGHREVCSLRSDSLSPVLSLPWVTSIGLATLHHVELLVLENRRTMCHVPV